METVPKCEPSTYQYVCILFYIGKQLAHCIVLCYLSLTTYHGYNIYIYIYACMYVCMYVNTTQKHIYTYIRTYARTYIHTYAYYFLSLLITMYINILAWIFLSLLYPTSSSADRALTYLICLCTMNYRSGHAD